MNIKKSKLLILLSGIAAFTAGCLGTGGNSTSSSNATTAIMLTPLNNPLISKEAKAQMLQAAKLYSSSQKITDPNSVVVDKPKVDQYDQNAYMGVPIVNNTGATINGFYIHNWDDSSGNYINGNNMIWPDGVEIAHTMQNNKYHDWYFPIGVTEANVNDSDLMWDAYGYLGGHYSGGNDNTNTNPTTSWTIELKIGGQCYYAHETGDEGHVNSIWGWAGAPTSSEALAMNTLGTMGDGDEIGADVGDAVEKILEATLPMFAPEEDDGGKVMGGFWSEFTPTTVQVKGVATPSYSWQIHIGGGEAVTNGSIVKSILVPVAPAKYNSEIQLYPDTSCASIDSKLPSKHPSGMSLPGGTWSSKCGGNSWDGNTLTASCSGHVSSLDTSICASKGNVAVANDGVSLTCQTVVVPNPGIGGGYTSQTYNANITALINANTATTNPFVTVNNNTDCQILAVTDNSPESATTDGISSITAECHSQVMNTSFGSNFTLPIVSQIDPQSCKDANGKINIGNLNGTLACGGGATVTVNGANSNNAALAYGNGTVTSAIPITDDKTLQAVVQSEAYWIGSLSNPVNNVSTLNYSQVCLSNNVVGYAQNGNLMCISSAGYNSSLISQTIQMNPTLFNNYINGTNIGNSCTVIGALADESGNYDNLEYSCISSVSWSYDNGARPHYIGVINPQTCYQGIMAESSNGTLSCVHTNVDPQIIGVAGNWSGSCYDAAYESNGTLTAACRNANNTYQSTSLNIADVCTSGGTGGTKVASVTNNNGYLSCDYSNTGWWVTLDYQYSKSTTYGVNDWLASGNSSCYVTDATYFPSKTLFNVTALCKNNNGAYKSSTLNVATCNSLAVTDGNGVLACNPRF